MDWQARALSSGKEGGSHRALYYLRQSNECNPQGLQTVYGLAFARDSIGPTQKHFPAVLEMAARELKARGPRKDGGLLSGWAMWLFRGKLLPEVHGSAFEMDAGAARAGHQRSQRDMSYGRCRGVSSRRWISRCIWARGGGWQRGW